jgi:tetratricopeptide (TPR) repeat protein
MKQDKMMSDLQRLLAAQDFESEEDVRKFMDNLVGKELPDFKNVEFNPKYKAQDLVFDALELPPSKAKANIQKALLLDPDCIEAYEYLGSIEESPEIASVFYEKGIAIGRRMFGGEFLKKNKGMFWGLHETRSFMRCLQQYADCLYTSGKEKECIAILEELIELNPNDNQGVRDQLLLYLIEQGENKKYLKYSKMFDDTSMTYPLFNNALFAFKNEGETDNSNKLLAKAINHNKFVAKLILSNRPVNEIPDHYGIGDKNEAKYYVAYAHHIWAETPGARDWLKKHAL